MRLGYSKQHEKPCIIIEVGDEAQEIIDMADEEWAIYFEGLRPLLDKRVQELEGEFEQQKAHLEAYYDGIAKCAKQDSQVYFI